MRRQTAICVLVAAGFAASALAQSAPEEPRASRANREPIIDVHLHAYPADEAIPDIANPANGKKPGVKTGEDIGRPCSPR